MSLSPSSGIGRFYKNSAKIIRCVRMGCTNRPFYHIVVMERRKNQHQPVIEQVGSYDPLPNQYNEKLVAFNFERIRYWLGNGAHISTPAAELLGIAGFLPIHPRTYMTAWRRRRREAAAAEAAASKDMASQASTETKMNAVTAAPEATMSEEMKIGQTPEASSAEPAAGEEPKMKQPESDTQTPPIV